MKLNEFFKLSPFCNMKEKVYLFKNLGDFEKNLRRMGCWLEENIDETISHERAHYEKTVELGYHPTKYGIKIYDSSFRGTKLTPIIGPFVKFEEGQDINKEDQIGILLAPKNPGFSDRRYANKLKNCLKKAC